MMVDSAKRIRDLVQILQFREELGQSYLVARAGQRVQLYVPTMLDGNPLEPATRGSFNWDTVRRAERQSEISIGAILPVGFMPEPLAKAVRRFKEDPKFCYAYPVELVHAPVPDSPFGGAR